MRRLRAAASIVAVVVTTACASGGTSGGAGKPRYSQNVITADELATVDVSDAYQAIQRLRPQFLTNSRGPTQLGSRSGTTDSGIQVYLNEQRLGDLSSLSQIPKNDIQEIRFLSASEASSRFGTGNTFGAIVVTRKSK